MPAMIESAPLPPPPDIDEALRGFFRAQLPQPWPQLRVPAPKSSSSWPRTRLRLALAASIALGLAGYLTLASLFRPEIPTQAIDPHGAHIADRPTHHVAPSDAIKQQ